MWIINYDDLKSKHSDLFHKPNGNFTLSFKRYPNEFMGSISTSSLPSPH